jgi:hypothetical protein
MSLRTFVFRLRPVELALRTACRASAAALHALDRYREIERNGPYMTRSFFYGEKKSRPNEKLRVCLHRLRNSDPTNELHSHPWTWSWSLILVGGYDEQRIIGPGIVTRALRAGDVNWLDQADLHRIDRLEGETWTLFVSGPRTDDNWGFWDPMRNLFRHHDAPRAPEPPGPAHSDFCRLFGHGLDLCCLACYGVLAKPICGEQGCVRPYGHELDVYGHCTLGKMQEHQRKSEARRLDGASS